MDVTIEGFARDYQGAAECRRQSRMLRGDPQEAEVLAWLEEAGEDVTLFMQGAISRAEYPPSHTPVYDDDELCRERSPQSRMT